MSTTTSMVVSLHKVTLHRARISMFITWSRFVLVKTPIETTTEHATPHVFHIIRHFRAIVIPM